MKFTVWATLFLLGLLSRGYCQQSVNNDTSQIYQIRYDISSGAKNGTNRHLVITKDSVLYDSRSYYYGSSVKIHLPIQWINVWDDLVKMINFSDFDKIKSNESRQPADGFDESITIQTSKKTHTEMNGYFNGTPTVALKDKLLEVLTQLKDFF